MSRVLSLTILLGISGLEADAWADHLEAPVLGYDESEDLDDLDDDFFEDASSSSSRSKSKKDRERDEDDEGADLLDMGDDDDPDFDMPDDDFDDVGDPDDDFGDPDDDFGDPDEDFGDPDDGGYDGDPDEGFGDPDEPRAADPDEPRGDDPDEGDFGGVDDDLPNASPAPSGAADVAAATGPTRGLGLSLDGLTPLTDNFPVTVVATDVDSIVVELPVLVAQGAGEHSGDYWLVFRVLIGERAISEQRHHITRRSMADLGPTVTWAKFHVPVVEDHGKVTVVVSRAEGDGDAEKIFSRTGDYRL